MFSRFSSGSETYFQAAIKKFTIAVGGHFDSIRDPMISPADAVQRIELATSSGECFFCAQVIEYLPPLGAMLLRVLDQEIVFEPEFCSKLLREPHPGEFVQFFAKVCFNIHYVTPRAFQFLRVPFHTLTFSEVHRAPS